VRWLDAQAPKLGKKFGQPHPAKDNVKKEGSGPDTTPKPPPRPDKDEDK
jgi:hypothetical protein